MLAQGLGIPSEGALTGFLRAGRIGDPCAVSLSGSLARASRLTDPLLPFRQERLPHFPLHLSTLR